MNNKLSLMFILTPLLLLFLAACGADDNEPEPCWESLGPSECIAPPDCRVPPECHYITRPDFADVDLDAVKPQLTFEKEGLNTLVITFTSEPVGLTVEMRHYDPPKSNSRLIGWRLDKTTLTIELFCDQAPKHEEALTDWNLHLEWSDGGLTIGGLCGPI